MIRQLIVSSLIMGGVSFGLWYWLIEDQKMNEFHARNVVLLLMVFMQNFHVFNCRSEYTSAFRIPIKNNYVLLIGVFAAQGIHILSMQLPFMQRILKVEPITLNEWFYVLVLAIPMILIMEVYKIILRKIQPTIASN